MEIILSNGLESTLQKRDISSSVPIQYVLNNVEVDVKRIFVMNDLCL